MTGRNNEPDRDGAASSPHRLDQFGRSLAADNDDEFESAAAEACETGEESAADQVSY